MTTQKIATSYGRATRIDLILEELDDLDTIVMDTLKREQRRVQLEEELKALKR